MIVKDWCEEDNVERQSSRLFKEATDISIDPPMLLLGHGAGRLSSL